MSQDNRDPVEPAESIDYAALEAEEEVPQSAPLKEETKEKSSRARKEITTEQLEQLIQFDHQALTAPRKKTVELVIGTDEVGRGCLAGPVMAAAVIMPRIDPNSELAWQLARLNDSKQVSPEVRRELAETLRAICRYAIGEASVEEIDQINILHASLLAMRRAIRRLKVDAPAVVLVDGNKTIASLRNLQQMTVIDGDTKSASIAAASIIAKVHRDAFMTKLAKKFPQYKWESNKGYRSREHWDAINQHGMCKWHRRSFVEHWLIEAEARKAQLQLPLEVERV
jgi:ribonuclease HII